MSKIVIEGQAQPILKYNAKHITKNTWFELDGIECDDRFSDYFPDSLMNVGIIGGYMRFHANEDGTLTTITEYDSENQLTKNQLRELADYTRGQWSDGIGEHFEQFLCFITDDGEYEYYISPWFYGQVVTVKQNNLIITVLPLI